MAKDRRSGEAGHAGAVNPVLRTGLAVALVVGVFAVGGCSSSPRCPGGASCPATAPRVVFTPTINGKSAPHRKDGHVPSYRVRPGEYLVMRVAVTVPKHVKITALWFGISTGTWGSGPEDNPVGMNPILAHYRQVLSAGSHMFGLRWRVPRRRSGASLYLIYAWSSHQPPASVSGPIATLALPQHVNRQLIWGGGLDK
jgi:hypothetical protein